MLLDHDFREIDRQRRAGTATPAQLERWIELLVSDRDELRRQLAYLRHRLADAFRYFDSLAGALERAQPTLETATGESGSCPGCGRKYERA